MGITLRPPSAERERMSTRHIVAQGEFLASIALQHGFRNWRVIWEHPDNAALKQRRKNPNVLFPGDELVIPERTEGVAAAATGRLTTFVTGTNDVLLNLTFENASSKPLASRSGQLNVGGRSVNGDLVKKGPVPLSTDAAGTLALVFRNVLDGKLVASEGAFAFDPLPPPAPGAKPAAEPVPPAFRFLVGDLDPVDTPSGQRARLNNLGYFAGFSERDQDQLEWAIEEFQADEKLADRGLKGNLAKDRPTLNRLAVRHGDMLKGEEL